MSVPSSIVRGDLFTISKLERTKVLSFSSYGHLEIVTNANIKLNYYLQFCLTKSLIISRAFDNISKIIRNNIFLTLIV